MNILVVVMIAIIVIFLILFITLLLRGTSQKGLEKILTKYGSIAARTQNNIINNKEEIRKETANKTADIHKDAVKTIVHSVKEGLSDDSIVYCKHCGTQIDADSTFCKKCGKQI